MKPTNNSTIALICLVGSIGLMVFLFAESRNDPSLRIAALVAGTGLVASLGSIASTILTGKDVTKPDPSDLPDNSKMATTTTTTVEVPATDPKVS